MASRPGAYLYPIATTRLSTVDTPEEGHARGAQRGVLGRAPVARVGGLAETAHDGGGGEEDERPRVGPGRQHRVPGHVERMEESLMEAAALVVVGAEGGEVAVRLRLRAYQSGPPRGFVGRARPLPLRHGHEGYQ